MFTLKSAELLQFQLGTAFGYADIRAVVELTAIFTLHPNVFSFTLFSHKTLLFAPSRLYKPGLAVASTATVYYYPPQAGLPNITQ